jgi:hypothetical protein
MKFVGSAARSENGGSPMTYLLVALDGTCERISVVELG